MKNIILIIFALTLTSSLKAQDRIIKISGDTLSVKIIKSTDDAVSFVYPNEEVVNEIYKN